MISIKKEQIAGMNQHYKRFSLDYFLDAQKTAGLQNIEFWLGTPHFWLDSVSYYDCKVVKKKLLNYGIKVVSTTSPSISFQYQYASPEKYHFKKSFKYFSNGIKCTAELGARIMTINSGFGYLNEDFETAFSRSRQMISLLCDVAKSEGITLALESLTSIESNIVNDIVTAKRMFDEVNNPVLKIMVDTVATSYARETTLNWFEVFSKDLIHMHFIDSDNCSDAHYIWGDGGCLLEKEIQNIKDYNYTGYLVQEIMDEKYLDDPASADIENMKMLLKFVDD